MKYFVVSEVAVAMTEEETVGQLEEEARKRRERLKARRQKLEGTEEEPEKPKFDKELPQPVFRSYNPVDEKFQESAIAKAKPIDIESQVADTIKQGEVKTLLEDVDLTNLAPRKPDWDLKRDIAPKLLKLERRTQKAIAELIFERLKLTQDLAGAVQAQQNPNAFDE